MKVHRPLFRMLCLSVSLTTLLTSAAFAKPTPEQDSLQVAKHLKPIPDAEWKSIAGDHFSANYTVAQGDSLYAISKRLFGDGKYWPKIWALNNGQITNPHLIRPGKLVAFMPGSGTSLPSVAIGGAPSPIEPGDQTSQISQTQNPTAPSSSDPEWKRLPHQRWEDYNHTELTVTEPINEPPRKLMHSLNQSIEISNYVTSDKIPILGKVFASSGPEDFQALETIVYIHAEADLQVGDTYAVTTDPLKIKSNDSDRRGYAYPILGKVIISSVKDQIFVARVIGLQSYLPRGSYVINLPPRGLDLDPKPGPPSVQALVTLDPGMAISLITQHKEAFIDRGSDDGVRPGMIFRSYQHKDPGRDGKFITDSDILPSTDLKVIQTSERFSLVRASSSPEPIEDGTTVTLLTDISDLIRQKIINAKSVSTTPTGQPRSEDELEQLDNHQGLGKNEEKELKQLEKWKANPTPSPVPTPAASPTSPPATPEPAPSAAPTNPPPAPTPSIAPETSTAPAQPQPAPSEQPAAGAPIPAITPETPGGAPPETAQPAPEQPPSAPDASAPPAPPPPPPTPEDNNTTPMGP